MSATSLNARPHPAAVDVAVADSTTYVHGVFDVHRWGSVCLTALADEALDIRAEWSMDGAAFGSAGDLDSLTNITTLVANQPLGWTISPRARFMRVCAENGTGNAATLSLDVFLHEAPAPSQPLDADEDSVEARCSGFDGAAWRELLTDADGRVSTQARLVGYDAGATTWRDVAVNGDGKIVVAPEATTPATFAYSGAASHTPVAISTGAGDLLSLVVSNSDSVAVYVWLYDDDDGTGVDENTVPTAGFAVAAGGSFSLSLPAKHPWHFADGVCFRATTGSTHTNTSSPSAPVHITIAYV